MNICLLCYRGNPYCGGQGIYLYYLSRALSKLGHTVTVLVGPPYPHPLPWANVVKIANKNFWGRSIKEFPNDERLTNLLSPLNLFEFLVSRSGYCPEALAFSVRAAIEIKKQHKQKPFDIIHDVETLGFGLLLARALGIPTISTVHHPLRRDLSAFLPRAKTFRERYYNTVFYPLIMQGMVARRIDGLITSSKVGLQEVGDAFRLKSDQMHLVYTGVDVDAFSPDPEIERDTKMILFVGNAEDRRKGVTYLLDALHELPEEITLTIVDEGAPAKQFAPELVRKAKLKHRVRFTGRVSDSELIALYRKAGVLVMPSLFEGFGLPVAEAMSCATPVVTTLAGSLPEVVGQNEEGGLLVPPKDGKALGKAINKILTQAEFSSSLSQNARRRALRLFSWDRTAENTSLVYQKMIGKRLALNRTAIVKGNSSCLTRKIN